MPSGLTAWVREANKTRRPEDSRALRAAVLGAVMVGAGALLAERAVPITTGAVALIALPFAYWISWRRRAKDNWPIKVALSVGAVIGLARFFTGMGAIATLDEARFPLAELFLWVQVLHGFDLPSRKDLNFSLGSSLALMAVAGSVSQDLWFAGFLVVYLGFAVVALALAHRSELAEEALGPVRSSSARGKQTSWREVARAAVATALVGGFLFLIIPQPSGVRSFALPFTVGSGLGLSAGGGIANPGFDGEALSRSSGTSYYGFSERMDLRVRGGLSDQVVMRVRSTAPAMWKGMTFHAYDGVAWTGDREEPIPLLGNPPYGYPPQLRSLGPRAEVIQTYYLESNQPSALLVAGQPESIWYDGKVSVDANGALRTDGTLDDGTVYSIVSSRGAASPAELSRLEDVPLPPEMSRYLQVPSNLPKRVGGLARAITAGEHSNYAKVEAIESYLRKNYRYTLDSPVPPDGRDAVDHFLFDAKVGFCEQFASATAVMLRTLGIPARVVVGYATGQKNAFTGYYEVRGSDAHAWVEVYFPRYGWYEFDPTFDIPPAAGAIGDTIPLLKVIRFIGQKVGALTARIETGLLIGGGGAVAAALGAGLWVWRRKRAGRRRARRVGLPAVEPAGVVVRAFKRLEDALSSRGAGRAPAETASELMARTADLTRPGTVEALETFERERYSPIPPAEEEMERAVAELERIRQDALGSPR